MKNSEYNNLVFGKVVILILCNFAIGITLYLSYRSDNVFALFIYIILGLIVFCQLLNILKTKNKIAILISLISIISVLIIYGIYEYKINKTSFLKAKMHGVYIDLKNDNTYVIKSGSWASKKHYYGKYKFDPKDSIIVFDKNINDGTLNSSRMKIVNIKNYINIDNKNHKYLIQLDQNNNEIQNDNERNWEFYRFEIN